MSSRYSNRITRMSWVETLSVLNLLALVLLYFNIFYWKNALLSEDFSIAKVGHKTALSISEAKTKFLACITPERVPETNRKWGTQFKEQLYDCLNQHIPIKKYELDTLKAINVEYKYFLPMDKSYYADQSKDCIWLTAGIGNNTQAEREFLKLYPKCKFFGIELVPANVADYGTFGKVINTGIGFDGKEKIVDKYTDYAGTVHRNLKIRPFVNILDQDVGSRLMHYAAIDIDGFEFPMLKEFGDSGQYHLNGVVICQMDIEWHAEIKDVVKDDFEFGTYMRQLFQDATSYLPIFAEPYSPGHPWAIKMTMINIKNSECELAFRFSKYFER
ncbi:hypothetical protein DdX_18439 [Ditylenchus destructor]|uniref:Methyltransferase FkbM domain-containing protein n=1 Tax=Ditylenchus destructor TaxID=166010 RepID=A0AAD4MKR6_9BILA|nr:hypothetical protein DdX_18439 [Ditylenchus destructor]